MDGSLEQWLTQRHQNWESLCIQCGTCCGLLDDPCVNLRVGPDAKSFCIDYAGRLGDQRTVSGKTFRCVNIREKYSQRWPGDDKCGYRKAAF